ncbi:MAG: hypothetical protein CMK59_04385 [Proteobacteria bacterium]|nr:hypothetical protein [Pseudomonadota bacterium]
MIFVTGTKRSGTSLWMQILIAAGYPYIGAAFPKNWSQSIGSANQKGFFESPFRMGVYYATNPDPKTGEYLAPEPTQKHLVKVFVPGLMRSDLAYIHRVVATIRPWREYVTSLRRLYEMEDEHIASKPSSNSHQTVEMVRLRRGTLHPALEWWRENFDLIYNFAVRKYPFNLVSYRKLLEAPEQIIPPVVRWCGGGAIEQAVACVEKKLNTQKDPAVSDSPLTPKQERIFDEFHEFFYEQRPLTGSFIAKLNDLNEELLPLIKSAQEQTIKAVREAGLEREQKRNKTKQK